jgi:hypothetical protein
MEVNDPAGQVDIGRGEQHAQHAARGEQTSQARVPADGRGQQ